MIQVDGGMEEKYIHHLGKNQILTKTFLCFQNTQTQNSKRNYHRFTLDFQNICMQLLVFSKLSFVLSYMEALSAKQKEK